MRTRRKKTECCSFCEFPPLKGFPTCLHHSTWSTLERYAQKVRHIPSKKKSTADLALEAAVLLKVSQHQIEHLNATAEALAKALGITLP
jgi:hypothetical protein